MRRGLTAALLVLATSVVAQEGTRLADRPELTPTCRRTRRTMRNGKGYYPLRTAGAQYALMQSGSNRQSTHPRCTRLIRWQIRIGTAINLIRSPLI